MPEPFKAQQPPNCFDSTRWIQVESADTYTFVESRGSSSSEYKISDLASAQYKHILYKKNGRYCTHFYKRDTKQVLWQVMERSGGWFNSWVKTADGTYAFWKGAMLDVHFKLASWGGSGTAEVDITAVDAKTEKPLRTSTMFFSASPIRRL
jgi:hypothetical protein